MNTFQDTIKSYLDKRAAEDPLFAANYAKEKKNIKECCAYITSQAKKQASNGCAAIPDDEVFGWAIHYYDENDIKVESLSNVRAEVKTSTSKTEVKRETRKVIRKPIKTENVIQLSLFEL